MWRRGAGRIAVYPMVAVLSLRPLIAVPVTSHPGEGADFARKPPVEISQHPGASP